MLLAVAFIIPASIKAEDKPVWSLSNVTSAAEELGISIDYIEKYNSFDLYSKKVKELNAQDGVITDIEYGGYLNRTIVKTVYMDEDKKLSLTITDSYKVPTSPSQLHYTQGDVTYVSTYKPIAGVTLKQYVAYTVRVYGLNQMSSKINDCYGVYCGVGDVSSDSNWSTEFIYNSWGRTS